MQKCHSLFLFSFSPEITLLFMEVNVQEILTCHHGICCSQDASYEHRTLLLAAFWFCHTSKTCKTWMFSQQLPSSSTDDRLSLIWRPYIMKAGQSFYVILVGDLKPLRLTVARIITICWISNCLWNEPNILSRAVNRQVTVAIDSAGIISGVTKKPKMKKAQALGRPMTPGRDCSWSAVKAK